MSLATRISKLEQKLDASDKHWGMWYLSKSDPLSLNAYPYGVASPYEIELSRLSNPNEILSWINHFLESKTWVRRDDIRDFMKACKDLIDEGLIKMPHVYRQGPNAMSRWGY